MKAVLVFQWYSYRRGPVHSDFSGVISPLECPPPPVLFQLGPLPRESLVCFQTYSIHRECFVHILSFGCPQRSFKHILTLGWPSLIFFKHILAQESPQWYIKGIHTHVRTSNGFPSVLSPLVSPSGAFSPVQSLVALRQTLPHGGPWSLMSSPYTLINICM